MQLGPEDKAFIETMTKRDSYEYLGILQLTGLLQTAVKENLLASFSKHLSSLLRLGLNSYNKRKATNSYAIPLLAYSFGLIKWSNTDLEGINRTIRTEMTKHRMHHRSLVIERIVLPRLKGVAVS